MKKNIIIAISLILIGVITSIASYKMFDLAVNHFIKQTIIEPCIKK